MTADQQTMTDCWGTWTVIPDASIVINAIKSWANGEEDWSIEPSPKIFLGDDGYTVLRCVSKDKAKEPLILVFIEKPGQPIGVMYG